MATTVLLEEAIKSWEKEIKDLHKMAEWVREDEVMVNSIKHKKDLIERAKMVLKENVCAGKSS